MLAIRQLKSGKAKGPDNIPPEFLIHCRTRCLEWLRGFYSNCFSKLTKPKIWRNATVIAIPKLNKPTDDPKNYRPISLLCVPFKPLERLLLSRLEPIIDPHLPDEQAGFRRGRSTVHQIVNLTDDIEEAFEKGHKAGAILVDPTAAYDMVWHKGLTLKLSLTVTLCGSSLSSSPIAVLHSKQATNRSANSSLFSRSDGNARESIKTHFEIIAFKDSDVKLSSFSILRLNKTYTI